MSTNANHVSTTAGHAPSRLWAALKHHIPNVYALLFALVRIGTVTMGAKLLRDIPRPIALVFGIAVAGLTLEMERRFVRRLANPIKPEQSLLAVIATWMVPLIVCVGLNSVAAFSIVAGAMEREHTATALQQHWTRQKSRSDAWILKVRLEAARAAAGAQLNVAAEQKLIAEARAAKQPYTTGALASARRADAAAKALVRQVGGVALLPAQAPASPDAAAVTLDSMARSMTDIYLAAAGLAGLPAPPVFESFSAPSVDLLSLVADEVVSRTSRAKLSLFSALIIETLAFISVFLGGVRTPADVRIRDWRSRGSAAFSAVIDRTSTRTHRIIPILLQPSGVKGTCTVSADETLTPAALWTKLAPALVRQGVDIGETPRFATDTGAVLDGDSRLLAIGDGALVIDVQKQGEAR